MKKTIWMILGAALLLGIVLFFCLREENPDRQENPSLPSPEAGQWASQNANIPDPAASGVVSPESTGFSGPVETEPELPVDWNRDPSETTQGTEGETPASEAPTLPGVVNDPSAVPQPSQTVPDEETQNPEETGGHIVIPILPPDIFP